MHRLKQTNSWRARAMTRIGYRPPLASSRLPPIWPRATASALSHMLLLDLLRISWIVLILLDSTNGQRSLPRCASLCAMNEASHENCFVSVASHQNQICTLLTQSGNSSDISCLCRSTFDPNSFGTCLKHTCGEHDREETQVVLAVLCGRRTGLYSYTTTDRRSTDL